jgi:glycosyltransferase involved in cell wall biosynthesis
MAKTGTFDLVFMLQDTFVVETFMKQLLEVRATLPPAKRYAIVHYFPIDGTPKKSWIENVVTKSDIPVAYTQYAKRECIKHAPRLTDMDVVYHGVDKDVFFPPTDRAFRDSFLAQHKDKFIVLNVNRNQPRKDLYRTLAGFSAFHKKYPKSFLFLLCQAQDVGGDIVEIAAQYGLEWDRDWACPQPGTYGANQGYPVEVVNQIYGVADVVVSTTVGEGWGLSFSEGAACKKPLLFPNNTSLTEMVGENEERGYFIKSGETLNNFTCMGAGDNNILRPTVDVLDMADRLEYIYLHPEEAKAKAERAHTEVWTWKSVGEQWISIFKRAEGMLPLLRSEGKISPNAPCPCGSGKKYKKCHGA